MAQKGYLSTRIYTSRGSIPIEGASVTVIKNNGDRQNIIARRITDRNGQIALVTIDAPDSELSLSPGNEDVFAVVDVRIDKEDFYTVIIKDVQVFGGQTTLVDTPLIPLIENEDHTERAEEFTETPQNL